MADTSPPNVNFNGGIYVPQLPEEFKISKSALYDYYSTNSGMYPKNPGGGGGGGGSEAEIQALKRRVTAVEDEQVVQNDGIADLSSTQEEQRSAAKKATEILSNNILSYDEIKEIEDIVDNQMYLSAAQQTVLNAME